MQITEIEKALDRAEAALSAGASLRGTGFWNAVDAARRDRAIADAYADRMAAIDRAAFEHGVRLRVSAATGVASLALVSAFGAAAVRFATRDNEPKSVAVIAFLIGTGALIVGTHSLTHWIVGRLVGIRFTHMFLGGPPPPRPGVKTDYATYLRATSRQRAAMHASGAIVTKLVPFALIPVAANVAGWLVWLLGALGVVQIVTDIALSTKVSDWKKVRRELRR